jgi:hypothetical protein
MFARDACYFFVRPRRSFLELVFFLDTSVRAPAIRKQVRSSRLKIAHFVQVRHRDEVEPPLTEWLRDAYTLRDRRAVTGAAAAVPTDAPKPPPSGRRRLTKRRPGTPNRRRRPT